VSQDQGSFDEALQAYRDGLAIDEQFAAADPSNTRWQRDFAVSYANVASVYIRLGNIANALSALQKGRNVIAALVTIVPDNAQWTKDLVWFESQIARAEGQARETERN